MPENLKLRGHAWSGRAEGESVWGEAVLEVGCWSRTYKCVNLPMDSLERVGQSTLEKAA